MTLETYCNNPLFVSNPTNFLFQLMSPKSELTLAALDESVLESLKGLEDLMLHDSNQNVKNLKFLVEAGGTSTLAKCLDLSLRRKKYEEEDLDLACLKVGEVTDPKTKSIILAIFKLIKEIQRGRSTQSSFNRHSLATFVESLELTQAMF